MVAAVVRYVLIFNVSWYPKDPIRHSQEFIGDADDSDTQ
jgi:hypothetical protein